MSYVFPPGNAADVSWVGDTVYTFPAGDSANASWVPPDLLLKLWDGSGWPAFPLKRWNGSDWETVARPKLKRWHGGVWEQAQP